MRTAARLTLTLLLALVAASVAGCGSDDSSSSKTSGTERSASTTAEDAPPASGKVAAAEATLDVQLEQVGDTPSGGVPIPPGMKCTRSKPATCSDTITCPVADGATEQDIAVCTWLATDGATALNPPKPDAQQACTMQYGGPTTATVTGTLNGEKIDATFSRQDGCAIALFDTASPLWTGEIPDPTPPVSDGGGAAAGSCPALPPDTAVSSSDDPAAGAADGVCATPATPAPPTSSVPPMEPEIISDPPEAFDK